MQHRDLSVIVCARQSPPRCLLKLLCLLVALLLAPAAHAAFPPANATIADCEDHWFLAQDAKHPDLRVLGFAYIDPQAGFTFEARGEIALDANGAWTRKTDSLAGKARVIVRVEHNVPVTCLDEASVARLGLPAQSEYLKYYVDKRPPGEHAVNWASHLNQIGASEQAIRQIDIARKAGVHSDRMWFELGYALDAQGHYDQAIAILEPAVAASPDATALLDELGFAHLHQGDYARAIALLQHAIDGYHDTGNVQPKWELAMHLAAAYHLSGDAAHAAQWLDKANAWRPSPPSQ